MAKLDKVERYDWADPGDRGQQRLVDINLLRIDHSYQRREVSEKNTLATAKDFNWNSFGTLVVMQRGDGGLYVVDGQQRLMACRRRGDIDRVPCIVFHSHGPEHEAQAFRSLNVCRKPVSSTQKFIAADAAGIQPERQISEWLSSNGLHITNSGEEVDGISFPAHLLSTWKYGENEAKEAIKLQREIIGGLSMNHAIHNGIWWLLRNGVNVRAERSKLTQMGGKDALLRAIRVMQIQTGRNGSIKISGLGILSLVNHKRRNKINPMDLMGNDAG